MSNAEIVVVGAGVAGLSAALAVADAGQDVTLVTKADLVESNTYHAQGGIAAAVFADDDPKLHAADTMAAGHGLCEPRAVEILTREGADRVRQFAAAGVHFDRDAQGHMLRGLEAAHSRARVVHAGGDATGKVVELDVSAMVRANPLIHIIEHAFLEDLIVRDGAIAGVRLLVRGGETFRSADMAASRVILATGGAGRLYPYTTNPAVATADGLAAAWRAGAQVADVEFYQFHPTAMAVGEHFLVSEAVRGEGAVLLDEHGERYMTRVDERAELAPRDVVARENFRVMQAQGGKPVMLDVSPMRRENPDLAEFLRHRFPTIDAYTRSLGFDWSKEPIPVAPAAHYYMGGIRTDLEGRASIPGLYAAGECARTGVMGSNRLASNSLLEGLVYGRRAGLAAERIALNFTQRMSGIASMTASFVDAVNAIYDDGHDGTVTRPHRYERTRIVDTRKTTPGLRPFEKYAVVCGGGHNHRYGLSDAVMMKDNHLAALAARGIDLTGAIRHVREQVGHTTHIEVEVDRLEQIPAVLAGGADTIMLDNFSLDDTRRGVDIINGKAIVEASGNMSMERVPAVAATGVDVISVGALTHSVRSIDLGLDWN